jgi:integrase
LIRSGDNWLGRWREDEEDANGVVKRPHKKVVLGTIEDFPTKRLAERELARRLEPINNVEYRPQRRITFEAFSQKWLKEVLVHQKRSSQSSARSHVRVHLVPAFGEMNLADIRMEQVQQFVTGSSKSPKMVKNVVVTLMSMWSTAQAWKYVQHNPFERKANGRLILALPAAAPSETYHFTVEEALAIIDKAQGPWRTFFRILAETGMRPGECAGLRVDDVGEGVLTVAQSVWGQQVQTPKSKNAIRTFAISSSLAKEIEEMVDEGACYSECGESGERDVLRGERSRSRGGARTPENRLSDGSRSELLFTTEAGKPLSMDNFRQRVLNPILVELGIDKKLERLGVFRCGNYAFRHMNATLMDTLNTPMKTRQKRLGHAQIETTLKHYTHAVDSDDRAVADAIGALFRPKEMQVADSAGSVAPGTVVHPAVQAKTSQQLDELPDTDPWREPLVRSDVIAAHIGVTTETVQRWSRRAKDPLPVLKFGLRGFARYRMSDVEAWLDRRRFSPAEP